MRTSRRRLRSEYRKSPAERRAYVEQLRLAPIALQPGKPNEQHYEEPPAFFELVLGPRMKYSSCLWEDGTTTLADAEDAMLALTCERAGLADGMEILDLGCGWGSLTLYAAERYPGARITAVSNSSVQREWIEARAPANVSVDHRRRERPRPRAPLRSRRLGRDVRAHAQLRGAAWRRSPRCSSRTDGSSSTSSATASSRTRTSTAGWRGTSSPPARCPRPTSCPSSSATSTLVERWLVSGEHYARTSEAWLERLAENEAEIERRFGRAFLERWRVFFLACAELFGYRGGTEWLVAHYLFAPR